MEQVVIEDFNEIEKYKDKLKEIKIWVCSPATGKSYLCDVDNRFFDLDVYQYKLPNDEDLENQIISKMFEIINDGRIVTNASHTFFVNYLANNHIPYCYVYAKPEAEEEYRQRMLLRGSGQEFVDKFGNIAERYAYKVKDKKPTFKIELKQKEYLSDYLWRIFGKPQNENQGEKMAEISEERQKENKVMSWWIEKLPQSKEVFDMLTNGYDSTKSVGIYVLVGSLVLEFYDKPLEKHNSEVLKNFLALYNQFVQEFKGTFLENIREWIPESAEIQDSIIAMVSTEMGEGTDPKDYDYVLNLMPEGTMKEEFKNFVNWAKNN